MKKIIDKIYYTIYAVCITLTVFNSSCKKDNDGGKGAPVITRVRTVSKQDSASVVHQVTLTSSYTSVDVKPVAFDSTVTAGRANGLYAIIGQNLLTTSSITINGTPVIFNKALINDNAVIFTIPLNIPFQSANSKITLVTSYGTTTFGFSILQPPPTITDASQFAGNPGDIITLTGTAFDNVSSVKFGTAAGQVTASTSTQITVKVPANASGLISVTTPGGTVTGPAVSYDGIAKAYVIPFGFNGMLYDDAVNSGGFEFNFNGVVVNNQSTDIVKRGTHSIMVQYNGNYAGYAVGGNIDLTGKTYVKFSIYGASTGTEGRVIKVALNDFDNRAVNVILHEKKWSTYVIPLSLFQNDKAPGIPAAVSYIGFQDLSGKAPETIYLDDIGVF
ncbi:IPT/TIG domain-containing protein [Mucilaginibacter oryzae]|uniref:IPT/TIG domain-containing protein n=1 Tax=Mucilaginibacter oryzae TaxID=468058 RepID=A0A316HG42_9SPHI|nr:IPT/TIG domain-containing protein [Mucilaginibacter oryzae]PWK77205.1 IPT/TIG domain-containing protein [Mucilaginibacter oryzae]